MYQKLTAFGTKEKDNTIKHSAKLTHDWPAIAQICNKPTNRHFYSSILGDLMTEGDKNLFMEEKENIENEVENGGTNNSFWTNTA